MDEEFEERLRKFDEQKDRESQARLEQLDKEWPLKDRILAVTQMKVKERRENELKELEKFEKDSGTDSEPIALSWKEFRSQTFEEPKWIVEGIIPEKGLAALAGSPESCKSLFSNIIAICVAKGELLLDKFQTIKTPVLIIDQENLPLWIQKRITYFTREEDLPLYIYQNRKAEFKVENEKIFNQVKNFIKQNHIGLVIIDTLRLIHSGEENSSTALSPVIDKLKELTEYTAVLLIHHNRKTTDRGGKGKAGGEDMMGSIFIRGSLDSQLTLIKVSDDSGDTTRVRVSHTKSRYIRPVPSFDLTLEENGELLEFIYQNTPDEELLKREDAEGTIKALLSEKSFSRQELIDQLKEDGICSQRTAETALAGLQQAGEIKHTSTKPHIYSLVEPANIPQSANTYIDKRVAESEDIVEAAQEMFGVKAEEVDNET